jgi:hypothetical protein
MTWTRVCPRTPASGTTRLKGATHSACISAFVLFTLPMLLCKSGTSPLGILPCVRPFAGLKSCIESDSFCV